MLFAVALLTACGPSGSGVGSSQGSLEIRGEEISFRGGAYVYDWDAGDASQVRVLVVTTRSPGFTCDAIEYNVGTGPEPERPRHYHDLYWQDTIPDEISVSESKDPIFGGSSYGGIGTIPAMTTFDDEARTRGSIETNTGTVTFEAEDCGRY